MLIKTCFQKTADTLDGNIVSETERMRYSFLSSLLFFFLGSVYGFIPFSPIHDGVPSLLADDAKWQVLLGRYFLPFYTHARSQTFAPLIVFLLASFYISISMYLVICMLDIRNKLEIILICGLFSVNPFTFEISAAHGYYADVFLFSAMLSCFGMYALYRAAAVKTFITAVIMFWLSFGVYPSALTFDLQFLIIICIKELFENRIQYKKALAALCCMGISGGIYLFFGKLAIKVLQIEDTSHRNSIFSFHAVSPAEYAERIRRQYYLFFQVFFDGKHYAGRFSGLMMSILFMLAMFLLFRERRKSRICAAVFVLAVFPLITRFINIAAGIDIALRTSYGQFLFGPFILMLIFLMLDHMDHKKGRKRYISAVLVLTLCILAANTRFNNSGYTAKNVLYERSLFNTEMVLEDLRAYGAQFGTDKIAVVGTVHSRSFLDRQLSKYSYIEGFYPFAGITYPFMLSYIANMLGWQLNANVEYTYAVQDLPEVKEMPCYPDAGYIRPVGEYIVVKLSEEEFVK